MKAMKSTSPFTSANVDHDGANPVLCGLVLAGGAGERVRPFVERLRGDSLPKQYVRFTGAHSMIEHTFRRAERLIPRERLFTVVDQSHMTLPVVREQLRRRHPDTVVTQPQNKDTGPGVLLPLVHIQKRYSNAVVALFPSDQFVADGDRLMRHIRLAYVMVKRQPSKLILLGIKPEYAEPEYGYILPNMQSNSDGWGTYDVAAFAEKPDIARARDLIACGALWNTMLMVFHVGALLQWVTELNPDIGHQFARIRSMIGTPQESTVLREVYDRLETVNFSKNFLEPMVRRRLGRLVVLPLDKVAWSDWGTERRIVDTLARMGRIAAPAPQLQTAPNPRMAGTGRRLRVNKGPFA